MCAWREWRVVANYYMREVATGLVEEGLIKRLSPDEWSWGDSSLALGLESGVWGCMFVCHRLLLVEIYTSFALIK
jgi:hypothetical protein